MRMTKRIEIINVLNEKVVIKPIDYKVALTVIKLKEESKLLVDKVTDMLRNQCNKTRNIKEIKEINSLILERKKLEKKEEQLRKQHNYWYSGLDNLDKDDIEMIKNKYPRRR